MSDIRQWLADLELDQYADAFEQNEIDIQLLPRLSDETLEKLGVSVIGHRIRLLDAIASLVDIDAQATGHTPVKQLEQDGKLPSTEAEAENRQLTIM